MTGKCNEQEVKEEAESSRSLLRKNFYTQENFTIEELYGKFFWWLFV